MEATSRSHSQPRPVKQRECDSHSPSDCTSVTTILASEHSSISSHGISDISLGESCRSIAAAEWPSSPSMNGGGNRRRNREAGERISTSTTQAVTKIETAPSNSLARIVRATTAWILPSYTHAEASTPNDPIAASSREQASSMVNRRDELQHRNQSQVADSDSRSMLSASAHEEAMQQFRFCTMDKFVDMMCSDADFVDDDDNLTYKSFDTFSPAQDADNTRVIMSLHGKLMKAKSIDAFPAAQDADSTSEVRSLHSKLMELKETEVSKGESKDVIITYFHQTDADTDPETEEDAEKQHEAVAVDETQAELQDEMMSQGSQQPEVEVRSRGKKSRLLRLSRMFNQSRGKSKPRK